MKNLARFILCGLFLFSTHGLWAQEDPDDEETQDNSGSEYIDQIKEKYLPNSKSLIIYKGGHQLASDQKIDGDILVINGDLVVYGELNGRAVVTNGDIIVKNSGRIIKDAIAVNGKVVLGDEGHESSIPSNSSNLSDKDDLNIDEEEESDFDGIVTAPKAPAPPKFNNDWAAKESYEKEMERFNREMEAFNKKMAKFNAKMKTWNEKMAEKNRYDYQYDYSAEDEEKSRDEEDDTYSASFVRVDDNPKDRLRKNMNDRNDMTYFLSREPRYKYTNFFLFDYNRVDGLYLGLKLDRNHKMYFNKPFQIYGEAGYAFSEKAFRYQLGVDKVWGHAYRFTLGGELHDLTNSQDQLIVGDLENALNALILKNDYRDYFRTLGFSFQASQELNESLKLSAYYRVDDYSNLENNVRWAVFFPKQNFRINPQINEGHMVSYAGSVELNTVSTISVGKKNLNALDGISKQKANAATKI